MQIVRPPAGNMILHDACETTCQFCGTPIMAELNAMGACAYCGAMFYVMTEDGWGCNLIIWDGGGEA